MTTLTEWRAPFQVNTGDASIGFQDNQNILGLANGWILVTWDEGQNGVIGSSPRGDIVGKIYDADGNVVYDSFQLNSYFFNDSETNHSVTATHDGFAISFVDVSDAEYGPDDRAIRFEQFDIEGPAGFTTVADVQNNFFSGTQIAANLDPDSAGVFVVYNDTTNDFSGARFVNEDGNLGRFIEVAPVPTGAYPYTQSVAVLNDGGFVTGYEVRDNPDFSVAFSITGPDGNIVAESVLVASGGRVIDVASLAGGGFVVAYRLDSKVYAQVYDASGSEVGVLHHEPNSSGSYGATPRVVGLHDGGFILAWDTGPVNDVFARRFNADGTPESDAFFVGAGGTFNFAQTQVGLAADGRVLFGWQGPNNEFFSSIWDPRGDVIDPDDYGQIRTNFLATDVITTGINDTTVLEGEIGDTILAQGGNDTIYTSGSGDFWGGGGDDLFILSATFPLPGDFRYINGETGFDTLDTRAVFVDYSINLETGVASYPGAPATPDEEFLNIENLITGAGDDTITGSDLWNVIETNGGDDTVNGGLGNDVLRGGLGNDTLNGEEGDDRLNGGDGDDILNGGTGNDRIYAEAGNDTVDGGDGDDHVEGKAGDDDISGGLGNDMLRGGDGADELSGGAGDDMAYGGNGDDILTGGTGNDLLNGNGGNDVIDGGEGDDALAGENGVDVINGGTGDDVLRGGGGDDTLFGDAGDDLLFGGANEDTLTGGDGDDILDGMTQADVLFGGAGEDILRGGDGFDTLDGGLDNDILAGGNGNDTLTGGLGIDTLRGNAQDDTFVFNSTAESTALASDIIDGFDGAGVAGGDVIDLSGIDADATLAGNQAFSFLGAVSSAAGIGFGAGGLWVEDFGGQTRLFGNTDADGVIDFSVRINDGPGTVATDYTAGDFIL